MLFLCLFLILFRMPNIYPQKSCSLRALNGTMGSCVHIKECPAALNEVKQRKHPQLCRYQGAEPIVCCLDPRPDYLDKIKVPEKEVTNTTKQENFEVVVDLSKYNGTKSTQQCLEYQKLVYPCFYPPNSDRCVKVDLCPKLKPSLVIGGGGEDAFRLEFPHMALLGYGNYSQNIEWLCGGSLISEKFILTAGHCSSTDKGNPITYAALGLLKRSDPNEFWKIFKIKRIINHPEYSSPSKYHDIALLETEKPVELDATLRPGCLHVGDEVDDDKVLATGWGALGPSLDNADTLQKIPLFKVPAENCSLKYPPYRNMLFGYDRATQMCYGDDGIPRDTCSGDSGGPVQIQHSADCMYRILGVTSFGKSCLRLGEPGIYTRVSYYVPWIESIVWP